ncbi:hypothetical protein E2C01_073005 [Portunus trituberculatus]|uniref:Uncharacterized protein n=1 Tax=Portunus trituberculatus TaxID=210409 RepID=A0A5B7IAI2_PORTR|nr:hypothetical protein [Portunus trituberculatus]
MARYGVLNTPLALVSRAVRVSVDDETHYLSSHGPAWRRREKAAGWSASRGSPTWMRDNEMEVSE